MKTFPSFIVATVASFLFTCGVLEAVTDDQGAEHWIAQQTSALAAMTEGKE